MSARFILPMLAAAVLAAGCGSTAHHPAASKATAAVAAAAPVHHKVVHLKVRVSRHVVVKRTHLRHAAARRPRAHHQRTAASRYAGDSGTIPAG